MQLPARNVELLAPAGGPAQLNAALDAGANAVYLGCGRLNMRARATNFPTGELPALTEKVHRAGARIYLTLNTLMMESDLPEMETTLQAAAAAGVDAVIAADWSVVRAATCLNLPVHISTQLSVSNSETLAFLYDLGIRRVVLARECSLQDLAFMRESLQHRIGEDAEPMEFEVFAHGAMCVAQSGRCFMSGLETGRSASRGDCAQPCRQSYTLTSERKGDGFRLEGEHILSPKDLCTLPFLEQLLEAGVSSLKLEGRNRTPDYVHTVVSAYRSVIDVILDHRGQPGFAEELAKTKQQAIAEVERVYNRGFSSGYYLGRPMKAWTTAPGNQANRIRSYIGQVIKHVPAERRTRIRLESGALSVGDQVFLEGHETGYRSLTADRLRQEGQDIDHAEKGDIIDLISDHAFFPADRMYRLIDRD
jgi:putative protease